MAADDKEVCIGCNGKYHSDSMTDVNTDGEELVRLCPRCVFIVALYIENGIEHRFTAGSLHPSMICSRYRKIVEQEFYKDPHATYLKYLGNMIRRQEAKRRILHVDESVIKRIDEFPFVFLPPEDAEKFDLKSGVDITLVADDLRLTRKLYGHTKIEAKYLKKYGQKKTSVVLFLPEVYDVEAVA